MAKVVTSDYAQMLLNGIDNFTATYFSEVIGTVSHDTIGTIDRYYQAISQGGAGKSPGAYHPQQERLSGSG